MPEIINNLYRQWCKQCNDFTLHKRHKNPDDAAIEALTQAPAPVISICQCGCQYSSVNIGDIDKEKLAEQRKRFKAQRRAQFRAATQMIFGMNTYKGWGPVVGPKTRIIESDAGLEYEEELERLAHKQAKEDAITVLAGFNGAQRNEPCRCGSTNKYKKCCMPKNEALRKKYNL